MEGLQVRPASNQNDNQNDNSTDPSTAFLDNIITVPHAHDYVPIPSFLGRRVHVRAMRREKVCGEPEARGQVEEL